MLKVFISHSWSENHHYERFVNLLEGVLVDAKWENVSIPRSAAIDILNEESLRHENEYRRLEEALWRASAQLRDPNLPDVTSRIVWVGGQVKEVPTVGSVRAEMERIKSLMGQLEKKACKAHGYPYDPKNASKHIRTYPELSIAIRDRLQAANLVFVLLTPLVRLKKWVDYEIALTSMVDVPIIGVQFGSSYISHDIHVDCDDIIALESQELRRVSDPFL